MNRFIFYLISNKNIIFIIYKKLAHMKKVTLFLLMICLSYSCKEAVDGESEPPKFQNLVIFDKEGGTQTITAKNNVKWWFDYFYIDNQYVPYYTQDVPSEELNLTYLDDSDKIQDVYKVQNDWFSVERIDYRTIRITVSKTDKFREFSFDCYRGNSSTKINVVQQSE